jgi:hypothetical protein
VTPQEAKWQAEAAAFRAREGYPPPPRQLELPSQAGLGPYSFIELATWVHERTGCNMMWKANQETLRRWVRDYGWTRIIEDVEWGTSISYFHLGGHHRDGSRGADPRWLASWEWQCFAPPEVTIPMCF